MSDLGEYVRAAFALDPTSPATIAPAARGALGQVSRLDIGPRSFAVKEIFAAEPPVASLMAAEVEFTGRASAAGVRVAACYPATDGRYAVPMPHGEGWLRLYDWLDAGPVDLAAPDLGARLGTLLGRLHLCSSRCDREPDGSPPDAWYSMPPPAEVWGPLAEAATAAHAPWARDLAARLGDIAALTALATPPTVAVMRTCHRDLHPENVLVDRDGEFVVIDWDDLGPADPSRELARLLLDWFYDSGILAAEAARETLRAYRATGAPGRIAGASGHPADVFGLFIASRLNFLRRQARVATDPKSEERHHDWAVREIDEALRLLPTPPVFTRIAEIDRSIDRG